MMQILNKVFIENGARPLFWIKKGKAPILLVNGKERAAVPSMKKGGRKKEAEKRRQEPFFPLFYPLLPVY